MLWDEDILFNTLESRMCQMNLKNVQLYISKYFHIISREIDMYRTILECPIHVYHKSNLIHVCVTLLRQWVIVSELLVLRCALSYVALSHVPKDTGIDDR